MAREKIQVGEYIFNTKKELRDFTKMMMQKLFKREILGDHPFLFELIKRHPDADLKPIRSISFFKAYPNPITGDISSPHVVFVNQDGSEEAFSWNSCVTGKDHGGSKILAAMRSSIASQVLEFKFSEKKVCNICGSTGKLEVDHLDSFSHLAEYFLYSRKDIPTEFIKGEDSRLWFKDSDSAFEKDWVEFHIKNATLQLLCKTCHKRKTKTQLSKHAPI